MNISNGLELFLLYFLKSVITNRMMANKRAPIVADNMKAQLTRVSLADESRL